MFKKILLTIIIILLFIGTSPIFGGNYGSSIMVSGSEELPDLFYEHNFFDTRTSEGQIAYCLEPQKSGTEESAYDVVIKYDPVLPVAKGVLNYLLENGYPNRVFSGFNVAESQTITAMAFRALGLEYLGLSRGRSAEQYVSEQWGDLAAKEVCSNLIVEAKKNQGFNNENIVINLNNNLLSYNYDDSVIGCEYILDVNTDKYIDNIKISVTGDITPGISYPENVNSGESFWITLPKKEAKMFGEITVTATYEHSPNSIVFLKAIDDNKQSYISYSNPIINNTASKSFNYEPQASSLLIKKTDETTGHPLSGVEYNIWREDLPINNSDYSLQLFNKEKGVSKYITDEKGEILIDNIYELGIYHLEEIKAKPGYEIKEEPENIVIDKFKHDFTCNITNNKSRDPVVFIQKRGDNLVDKGEESKYQITNIINAGNSSLNNFMIEDFLPYSSFTLNKELTVDKFVNSEAYELYLTDKEGNTIKVNNFLKDENDELIVNWSTYLLEQNHNNVNSIFLSDNSYDIITERDDIVELSFQLTEASTTDNIITPVFETGTCSLYIQGENGDELLSENLDGTIAHQFTVENITGYRVVFNDPVDIKSFKLEKVSNIEVYNHDIPLYDILVDTNYRKELCLGNMLKSNIQQRIDLQALYDTDELKEGEVIEKINIIFQDKVRPGFRLEDSIILSGTVKSESTENAILNQVRVSGYDLNNSYSSYCDEWDIALGDKSVKLPNTGNSSWIFVGISIILTGSLILLAGVMIIKKND
ncbi:MAG: prealbumin-like fold domain-containing protein [Fusobacteria bacterium]|nr:prealbumin-like fold domain-containing protein [Fusobacteriota bacterium]